MLLFLVKMNGREQENTENTKLQKVEKGFSFQNCIFKYSLFSIILDVY